MFILRKITGTKEEINIALGDGYSLTMKERNPKEFDALLEKFDCKAETTFYGAVFDSHGECIFLSSRQKSYIMTSDGKTFDNLTLK